MTTRISAATSPLTPGIGEAQLVHRLDVLGVRERRAVRVGAMSSSLPYPRPLMVWQITTVGFSLPKPCAARR